MRVFIYNGGLRLVGKSGVGQAILHQREMLRRARIDTADHWCQRAGAVHINTVLPDSVLAALAAKLMGRKVIYYGHSTMEDFRRSFRGSDRLATPLPQVDHLLLQPGRRGADPHGILPPFAGELRPQAAGVQHFQRRGYRVLRAGSHPGGRPSAAAGASGKGSGR